MVLNCRVQVVFSHKSKSSVILVTPLEGLHFYILPNWDDGSVMITH